MSILDPSTTTPTDLVTQALKEAGVIGVGQTALAEDINDGLGRLTWMILEWSRKRWIVFALKTLSLTSTGALSYSVGPGGNFDTGANSLRPPRVESGYFRQLTQAPPNQVDYPLEILQAREDYNKIALKSLTTWPTHLYYQPDSPLGTLFVWPVPQATIYGIFISILTPLAATNFALTPNVALVLPPEYYNAVLYNLAIRFRSKYSIPSFPGDMLPGLAKDGMNLLRGANTQIGRLTTPGLSRGKAWNIFSDQFR